MSQSAFQTMYRDSFIASFEKRNSVLVNSVTTEAMIKGGSAVFLVAGSGGATAVSRGLNGDIPTRADDLNQYTATLTDWHDVPERTNFNIFASQGDAVRIMQEDSMAVINRKRDDDIRTALSAATSTTGSAAVASITLVTKAKTKIRNATGDDAVDIYAAITPAFHGYLMGLAQFTSADYIQDARFQGVGKDKAFSWYGVNWVVDSGLSGAGTASATCYMYAKSAIGHACDKTSISTLVGYDEKNDKSWARTSIYMGSKLLQNSGVLKIIHDDSALS